MRKTDGGPNSPNLNAFIRLVLIESSSQRRSKSFDPRALIDNTPAFAHGTAIMLKRHSSLRQDAEVRTVS
jgi:hypothetical protein